MTDIQILCVDTSSENGFVSLGLNGLCSQVIFSNKQTEHAAFLQPAMAALLANAGISFSDLNAIAVSNGPGSYTGLRVSLASAKAIAYAANKPLILLSSLQLMAHAMRTQLPAGDTNLFLAPMIDARRQEVYTAVYDYFLKTIVEPMSFILHDHAFHELLSARPVYFSGSGAQKWREMNGHIHARFMEMRGMENACCAMAHQYFIEGKLANLAYAEPFYLKPFFEKGKHFG
jgi:tRNA threonylcarbamoyladenosine biosynthesis protein TsaB